MIAHGKDIKIFAGNSNRVLAQEICQHLNTKLGDSEVGKFAMVSAMLLCMRVSAEATCSSFSPPATP